MVLNKNSEGQKGIFMATNDEDWRAFLDSTKEEPEEVETGNPEDEAEDSEEEEQEDEPNKSKKVEGDESEDDESEDEDDDEGDDSENDDESEEEDKQKSQYKPKIKQFLDKDGNLDVERVEKQYIENSKESVRLNEELERTKEKLDKLNATIESDPELAKKFGVKPGEGNGNGQQQKAPRDPMAAHMEAQLRKQMQKDMDDFIKEHPEAATDKDKAKKISKFLKRYHRDYAEDYGGEIPNMKEALHTAYRYYGWSLGPTDEERTAAAAKKHAATQRTPQRSGKKKQKSKVTDLESVFAKKLGVKL